MLAIFEEAYLKTLNTESEDAFGENAALDGNTLAVGTILEYSNDYYWMRVS